MAWGTNAPQGADDLLSKAQRGGSLCVMPFRRFGAEECAALCAGLPSTGVLELLASGHAIGEAGAAAVGGMLAQYRPLRRLAVGDSSFGDAGADAITVSAVSGAGTYINGNADNDTITVGSLATDNTVAGGNNADLITVSAVGTGLVAGGKGHDVITVSGAATTTVYGGLGADTINLGGAAVLKVNAGDSTIGTMDIVSGGFPTTVNTVTAVIASSTTLLRSGAAGPNTEVVLEISGGVIASGDFSVASGMGITATVAEVDKLSSLSKGGNAVAFVKNDDTYLFIQGGTVGSTTDDIVVKFEGSGTTLTVADKTKLTLS